MGLILYPLLYTLLGALLALLGGFLSHDYRSRLETERSDRELIFEVLSILHEPKLPEESVRVDLINRIDVISEDPAYYEELINYGRTLLKLALIALKIKSRKYREFSVMLTKYSLDEPFRSDKYLTEMRRVGMHCLNEKMIVIYEKETEYLHKDETRES